jgi:hypothetical protein
MRAIIGLVSKYSKIILTIIVVGAAYSFAKLPALPDAERALLASRFSFTKLSLPEIKGYPQRFIRAVHPELAQFSAWISSVGASVALNDLDGDGLSNDACYVDTRINQVIVTPVPGTPARYQPFTLRPSPLQFDPDTMAPMGCLPGDFNEDGLMDIAVYYWGRPPILFLRAARDSKAPLPLTENLYLPYELAPNSDRWYTNAATQADLDGDGHIDLVIGNYFPDGARILDPNAGTREVMQHSMSRAYNGGRNRLLLWAGVTLDVAKNVLVPRFEDVEGVLSNDLACGWTLAVGAADLDGDLLPEIYFANDFGPDRLLHNLSQPGRPRFELLMGEKTLTTPSSKVLGRDSFKGMGVDFGDLNGDGWPDIYVSNIAAEYSLEESHFVWVSTGRIDRMKKGVAPYNDRSEEMGLSRSGWGWDCRLDDFDNDGEMEAVQATGFLKGSVNRWPELHELAMGNDQLLQKPGSWPRFRAGDDVSGQSHLFFFARAQNSRYYDLAHEIGLDDTHVNRGIAIADVDGDGRLDFAVANQWDASQFYHNESQNAGAFLELHLLLPSRNEDARTSVLDSARSGRPAIGASATVYLPDGRRLASQVDGGSGHSGKRSPDLHFGLGRIPADAQLRVDLRWRAPGGQARLETFFLSQGRHAVLLGQ